MEKHPDLEEILTEIKTELRESFLIDFYERKFENISQKKLVFEQLINIINPDKAIKLYKTGIASENWEIKNEISKFLGVLIKIINPDTAIELYQTGIRSYDSIINRNTSLALKELVKVINPDTAIEFYKTGIASENWEIKMGTLDTFAELIKYIPSNKAIELYEEGIINTDTKIWYNKSKAINALLKVIPSDNAIELYLKGILNENKHIRYFTARAFKDLLPCIEPTEAIELYKKAILTNKSEIIDNVLLGFEELIKRIEPGEVIELYKIGILSNNKNIKKTTTSLFGEIIQKIESEKAIELYLNGISSKNSIIRNNISKGLEELIKKVEPNKAIELYLNGISSENGIIRENASKALGELIKKIEPDKALVLFNEGMMIDNQYIQKNILNALENLIKIIKPEDAINLYKQGINSDKKFIRDATKKILPKLLKFDPENIIELYIKNDRNIIYDKNDFIESLKTVKIDYPLKIFESVFMDNNNPYLIKNLEFILKELIKRVNPEKAIELYTFGISKNKNTAMEIVTAFGELLKHIDTKTSIKLYHDGINNPIIREKIIEFSNELFSKVITNIDEVLEPQKMFITQYFSSKYVKDGDNFKSKEQIISELKKVVQNPNKNYSIMSQIVKAGKASNLEEIIECSEFESTEGDLFLQKLGSGGVAGITYLVESPKLGSIAVKVLKKGKYNPKEVEVLNKLAKDEEKLENIVRFISAPSKQISRNGENVETIFMEFIDGQNLETIYTQNPTGLEEKLALNYSRQLLKGILDLRRKEIFHRDIHLGNVMVDNLGKLKIVDFGIAENNLNSEPESNLRHGGVTDLVSWAFITYELFSGEHLLYNRQTMVDNKTNIRDEINDRKNNMFDFQGELKDDYLRKIEYHLPEYLHKPINLALTRSKDYAVVKLIQKIVLPRDKIGLQNYLKTQGINVESISDSFYDGLEKLMKNA